MLVSEDVYNKTPEKTNTGNHNDQVTCRIMIFFIYTILALTLTILFFFIFYLFLWQMYAL